MNEEEKALVEVLNQMTQEEKQLILEVMREALRKQNEGAAE